MTPYVCRRTVQRANTTLGVGGSGKEMLTQLEASIFKSNYRRGKDVRPQREQEKHLSAPYLWLDGRNYKIYISAPSNKAHTRSFREKTKNKIGNYIMASFFSSYCLPSSRDREGEGLWQKGRISNGNDAPLSKTLILTQLTRFSRRRNAKKGIKSRITAWKYTLKIIAETIKTQKMV